MTEIEEEIVTLIFEINDHGQNVGSVHWPILIPSEMKYWQEPNLLKNEVLVFFCENNPHFKKENFTLWYVGDIRYKD